MSLRTNTIVCNSVSRVLSLLSWDYPLSSEPLGERKLQEKKELLWENAISGEKILELCPDLSEDDLAALIEEQLKCTDKTKKQIFADPYILVDRSCDAKETSLSIGVAAPYTETPHVSYRIGMKEYDFSKIFFEKSKVKKYIDAYSAKKIDKQNAKAPKPSKQESDRPAWVYTITKTTELLINLYEGRQQPLTKPEARKLASTNKEAFEAWWRCVPDKFKAGRDHSRKNKPVQ